jgi:tight adherence protein B
LPLGLGSLLFLIKPEVISLLWLRPLGIKMLYAGAVMITIGSLIIRKIVRIRV